MEFEDIIYEKREHIAKVMLNRPKTLNSMRPKTWGELIAAFEDAGADKKVGVVVLTGTGRSFCAGGDIHEFADIAGDKGIDLAEQVIKWNYVARTLPKPIIAAVNGLCYGYGNELLIVCDMAIASEDAIFCQPEMIVGSSPTSMVDEMLPLLIGYKRAMEFVVCRREWNAEEAARIGMINKVVPKDKLEEEVNAWCQRILEGSPQAIKFTKTIMNAHVDMLWPVLTLGMRAWTRLHPTEEWREGFHAFLEKRKPDYEQFRK